MKKLLLLALTAVLALAGSANAEIYYKEAEAATDLGILLPISLQAPMAVRT